MSPRADALKRLLCEFFCGQKGEKARLLRLTASWRLAHDVTKHASKKSTVAVVSRIEPFEFVYSARVLLCRAPTNRTVQNVQQPRRLWCPSALARRRCRYRRHRPCVDGNRDCKDIVIYGPPPAPLHPHRTTKQSKKRSSCSCWGRAKVARAPSSGR